MTSEAHIPDSVDLESYSIEHLIASDPPSGLNCPECGGSLWQLDSGTVRRYQCHVGHAFVMESLLKTQGEEIERHLWTLLRLLKEQSIVARELADQAREQKRSVQEIEQIEAQAQQALNQAEQVRQVLLSRQVSPIVETRTEPLQSDPI